MEGENKKYIRICNLCKKEFESRTRSEYCDKCRKWLYTKLSNEYSSHTYEEYLHDDCPERMWNTRGTMNCPDAGQEELEKITREYMKIQEKINELPPDKEHLKKIFEYKKELLLKETSQLFKSEEEMV